jgi:hypothetical protein
MQTKLQQAIEVLRNLPDEKAEIAATAIFTLAATPDDDGENEPASSLFSRRALH